MHLTKLTYKIHTVQPSRWLYSHTMPDYYYSPILLSAEALNIEYNIYGADQYDHLPWITLLSV